MRCKYISTSTPPPVNTQNGIKYILTRKKHLKLSKMKIKEKRHALFLPFGLATLPFESGNLIGQAFVRSERSDLSRWGFSARWVCCLGSSTPGHKYETRCRKLNLCKHTKYLYIYISITITIWYGYIITSIWCKRINLCVFTCRGRLRTISCTMIILAPLK